MCASNDRHQPHQSLVDIRQPIAMSRYPTAAAVIQPTPSVWQSTCSSQPTGARDAGQCDNHFTQQSLCCELTNRAHAALHTQEGCSQGLDVQSSYTLHSSASALSSQNFSRGSCSLAALRFFSAAALISSTVSHATAQSSLVPLAQACNALQRKSWIPCWCREGHCCPGCHITRQRCC